MGPAANECTGCADGRPASAPARVTNWATTRRGVSRTFFEIACSVSVRVGRRSPASLGGFDHAQPHVADDRLFLHEALHAIAAAVASERCQAGVLCGELAAGVGGAQRSAGALGEALHETMRAGDRERRSAARLETGEQREQAHRDQRLPRRAG